VLINNEPVVVPETVNFPFGVVVPIPILLPDWNIIELDIVLEELNKAILWVVPGPTGANEALLANDDVIETEAVVAKEAVPVNEPDMEPVSPAPINVIPLLDTSNDPVITAFPVNGNPAVAPPAFSAYDAVPKNEPEYIPSPVVEPPEITSTTADDEALLALTAQLAVPKNPTALIIELVYEDADTDPVTFNPASICVNRDGKSTRIELDATRLSMWSVPLATGILPTVNPTSLPNAPVFTGPAINIPLLYGSPLIFSYMNLWLRLSQ